MTLTSSTCTVFANNRFLVGIVKFAALAAWIMAALFLIPGITKVFHTQESALRHIIGLLGVLITTAILIGLGRYMWELGVNTAFYQAGFENEGLRFRLGTPKNPQEKFFAWDQIAAVEYKRVINTQFGSVVGKDDSTVQFSSYTFFRPKKLVKLIAARSGQPIREMAS